MLRDPVRPSTKKLFLTPYGFFTPTGREYVITRPDTPKPWSNVICPREYGTIVTQAGTGYSWMTHASSTASPAGTRTWSATSGEVPLLPGPLARDPLVSGVEAGAGEGGPLRVPARHRVHDLRVDPPGHPEPLDDLRSARGSGRDLAGHAREHDARDAHPRPVQLPGVEPGARHRHAPRVPQAVHRATLRPRCPRARRHQAAQHHRRARPGGGRETAPAVERRVAARRVPRRERDA